MADEAIVDNRTSGKPQGAAGPTARGKGKVEVAPWQRWHFSPLFVALGALLVWACAMGWQTVHHPGTPAQISAPDWITHINNSVSNTARHLIDTMQ
jgi:hypothetical protein